MGLIPRPRAVLLSCVALCVVAPSRGSAQSADDSYFRARSALDRAVEWIGGEGALGALQSVHATTTIEEAAIGQAAGPEVDPPVSATHNQFWWDAGERRTVRSQFAEEGDAAPQFHIVATPTRFWAYIAAINAVRQVERGTLEGNIALNGPAAVAAVLREALAAPASLRWIGRAGEADVVTFAQFHGSQVDLFVEPDGRVSRTRTLKAHEQHGDADVITSYGEWRQAGGLRFPHLVEVTLGPLFASRERVAMVEVDVDIPPDHFAEPEGTTPGPVLGDAPGAPPPPPLVAEPMGDGLFLIRDGSPGYNVMVQVFDDFAMVLETPFSAAAGDRILALARGLADGKPIRYAVPTHYHHDHSGALAAFVAEDVTILTTAGNEAWVHTVAAAPRTLSGGEMSGPKARTEAFALGRVVTDGTRTVELIDIGPNPHVDEMVVFFVPAERLLFVADLFSFRGEVRPANPNQLAFADRLEELDLDFDRIVPVHGVPTSADVFWESVRLGRAER